MVIYVWKLILLFVSSEKQVIWVKNHICDIWVIWTPMFIYRPPPKICTNLKTPEQLSSPMCLMFFLQKKILKKGRFFQNALDFCYIMHLQKCNQKKKDSKHCKIINTKNIQKCITWLMMNCCDITWSHRCAPCFFSCCLWFRRSSSSLLWCGLDRITGDLRNFRSEGNHVWL